MMTEFAIRDLSRELRPGGFACSVSVSLPGIDFALQQLRSWYFALQALAAEDADFYLCHVQPTRMLGCVMKSHTATKFAGRFFPQHELNPACSCVSFGQQPLDEPGPALAKWAVSA